MNKTIFMIVGICALISSAAQAERMRDFSMPIDESISRSNATSTTIAPPAPSQYEAPTSPSEDSGNDLFNRLQDKNGNNSAHFMEGYCDPNTQIGIATRSAFANCIAEKRRTACEEYSALPSDIKTVMNLTIDCLYAKSGGTEEESEETGAAPISMPKGCETTGDLRIELLKKYHGDAYLSHALLFLPDMALSSGASCVTER